MSRTLKDVVAELATKNKELQDLLGTDGKTLTEAEFKSFNLLKPEVDKLKEEARQLKSIEDARADATKTAHDLRTPDTKHSHSDGQPSDERENQDAQVIRPNFGSLKHINIEDTRAKNEEVAYKFFQFFAAYVLPYQHPQLNGIKSIQTKAQKYCEQHGIKALAEGAASTGGVLVPPEFDTMLIRLIETYGRFRMFAQLVPMASETRTNPRRTGSVTAYWVGEGSAITASNPTYDNIQLVAKKLAALAVMSSEISEDSAISIADQLAFEIGYAFSLMEDQAGFIGDGTITYGGIVGVTNKLLNLSSTIANISGLKVATGNAYSEIVLADFNGVVGLLPQYADTPNTAWYVHKTFFHTVMQKLELAAGGVTANEISTGDRRPRPLFLGYPVNFVQVMPRVEANSQVCALFGDLALAAMMGDRRARSLFTDPYSLAANDQIQVRATERIDINVHDVGNASGTASLQVAGPVVGLITAAS